MTESSLRVVFEVLLGKIGERTDASQALGLGRGLGHIRPFALTLLHKGDWDYSSRTTGDP